MYGRNTIIQFICIRYTYCPFREQKPWNTEHERILRRRRIPTYAFARTHFYIYCLEEWHKTKNVKYCESYYGTIKAKKIS